MLNQNYKKKWKDEMYKGHLIEFVSNNQTGTIWVRLDKNNHRVLSFESDRTKKEIMQQMELHIESLYE